MSRKHNIGDKYYKLVILNSIFNKDRNIQIFTVKCDCGKIYNIGSSNWRNTKCCRECYKSPSGINHQSYKGIGYISSVYYNSIKTHAKNSKREFNISMEYLNDLFIKQNMKCSISNLSIIIGGVNIETTASLDRIDSSKGYIEGNVQWVHKDVNRMKSDFNERYFINLCKTITENN